MTRRKPQILYVDDEPLMRRTFQRAVRRAGYEVTLAASGREAVELASRVQFDVVLSDFALGDLTGLEVLGHIRALQPGCALILVSGYFNPSAEAPAMKAAGVSIFIEKPWDNQELIRRIEQSLGAR